MVEVNKTIQFTDNSGGTIVSSIWDFGDGSPTASGLTASHVYTSQGNYNVKHTVNGTSCTQVISVTAPVGTDWRTPALIGLGIVAAAAITYGLSKPGKQKKAAGG